GVFLDLGRREANLGDVRLVLLFLLRDLFLPLGFFGFIAGDHRGLFLFFLLDACHLGEQSLLLGLLALLLSKLFGLLFQFLSFKRLIAGLHGVLLRDLFLLLSRNGFFLRNDGIVARDFRFSLFGADPEE